MFVGKVDLGPTGLQVLVVPLKGTKLEGCWDIDTDLLYLCVHQSGRCCACKAGDHYNRFEEKLGLSKPDAEGLAKWLKGTFNPSM